MSIAIILIITYGSKPALAVMKTNPNLKNQLVTEQFMKELEDEFIKTITLILEFIVRIVTR